MLNLEPLEDRMNLSPTFDWAFNSFALGDNYVAYGAADGGGPHVQVFRDGELVYNDFPFENSFRGGVSVGLADLGGDGRLDLIAGAGSGGAPRVRVYTETDGEWDLVKDSFVDDSSLRCGIYVGLNGETRLGYQDQTNLRQMWAQPLLHAEGYGNLFDYGTFGVVNSLIDFYIPEAQQRLLVDAGLRIYVHGTSSIVELGLIEDGPTPAIGDRDRTWGDITTFASSSPLAVFIGSDGSHHTLHEIGHAIQFVIGIDLEWVNICKIVEEPTEYEAGRVEEAFAEAYARRVQGLSNHPLVDEYLTNRLPW